MQKWISTNPGLKIQPPIGFTSLKTDLRCHFRFLKLGFFVVHFSNTLERPDLFLGKLVYSFAKPGVKLTHFRTGPWRDTKDQYTKYVSVSCRQYTYLMGVTVITAVVLRKFHVLVYVLHKYGGPALSANFACS